MVVLWLAAVNPQRSPRASPCLPHTHYREGRDGQVSEAKTSADAPAPGEIKTAEAVAGPREVKAQEVVALNGEAYS